MHSPRQRGSALLVTIVVLLSLSAIALALVAVTETGHRSAAMETHQKDALYVAEIGLRLGEQILNIATANQADALLQHVATGTTAAVTPSVPVFPRVPAEYDIQHLGTFLLDGTGHEVAARSISVPALPGGRPAPEAFISLYVRNNPDDVAVADNDLSTNAREDNDFVVNLVAVGWVTGGGRVLGVKILEERYGWAGVNQAPSAQKLSDAGGTGSGQFGG